MSRIAPPRWHPRIDIVNKFSRSSLSFLRIQATALAEAMGKEVQRSQSLIQTLKKTCRQREASLKESTAEIDRLYARCTDLERERDGLRVNIEQLEDQNADLEEQFASEGEILNGQILALQAQLGNTDNSGTQQHDARDDVLRKPME